jgi:hypothetical protein
MAYAFIGSYFLDPYLALFEEALNLAADALNDAIADDADTVLEAGRPRLAPPAYTLIRSKNVGMTALLLFAREPSAITHVAEAEVGFGAAEMGNKGAVGLRVRYSVDDGDDGAGAELTFVATHLAAMEWNLARRNANWAAIMRGLTFEDPEKIMNPENGAPDMDQEAPDEDNGASGASAETVRLLQDQHHAESHRMQGRLQDISVYKPTSHLFVAGDLNYRISATAPTPDSRFPSLDPDSENYYPHFLPLDQLTRERKEGRTLHGLTEAEVCFPPTYKYDVTPRSSSTGADSSADVAWKFAPHRYPSWTDRVLYLDIPPWTKEQKPSVQGVKVRAYDCMPVVSWSDHRAVFLRAEVPVLGEDELRLPGARKDAALPAEWSADPRARLPVAIDPEAWARRAAARQKEVMVGWSMFFGSTQEGGLILASLFVVTVASWWLYQRSSW